MIYTVTFNPSLDYICIGGRLQARPYQPHKLRADASGRKGDQRFHRADESWNREYSTWFHGRIRRR